MSAFVELSELDCAFSTSLSLLLLPVAALPVLGLSALVPVLLGASAELPLFGTASFALPLLGLVDGPLFGLLLPWLLELSPLVPLVLPVLGLSVLPSELLGELVALPLLGAASFVLLLLGLVDEPLFGLLLPWSFDVSPLLLPALSVPD